MTTAEATRQYQAALEHRRRARTEIGDTVSLEEELEQTEHDCDLAQSAMIREWAADATDDQVLAWARGDV